MNRTKTKSLSSSHQSLARNDAALHLAGFGILTGLAAGLFVNGFRLVLELPFNSVELTDSFDDFESLPTLWHFLLPVIGASVLALFFSLIPAQYRMIGVSHVIDKVQNLKSHMPFRNAIVQFFGAAIALLTGQSCGREGPVIHLGATSGSILGQAFGLPNNANRILIACGAASAISASFNTPIAGVIFAMEVIMMEYTVAAFLPIIIAAVSGAVVTQIFYGNSPVFLIDSIGLNSLLEIPYVIFMGVVIGILASAFTHLHKYCQRFSSIDIRIRFLLAGLLTGLAALFVPEIMGVGYDTLNSAFAGNYDLAFLFLLLSIKLIISAISLGLGIPGGLIGPTLIIGGIGGALIGHLGDIALPDYSANPAFYVLLGMCAMMGTVLKAPLAALTATFELSNNPNLILPAMLIIVVSNLTSSELFKQESIYQMALRQMGVKTPNNLSRLLNSYGVSSIMSTDVLLIEDLEKFSRNDAHNLPPNIILATEEPDQNLLVSRTAFLKHLESGKPINGIEATKTVSVSLHSTLQHTMEVLQKDQSTHALVKSPLGFGQQHSIMGIIGINDIIDFYKDR